MSLDDPLRDREAKADALACGLLRLPEAVEDMSEMLRRDAWSRIRHREQVLTVTVLCSNRDRSARAGELDRVADEVREDLKDHSPIADDIPCVSKVAFQSQRLLRGDDLECLEAERTGVPYQTILRQWVAFGAANAQRSRRRTPNSPKGSSRKPRK